MIKKIIDQLPKNQKAVLLMRDLDGFRYEENLYVTSLKIMILTTTMNMILNSRMITILINL